jgi:hypothetical protein
MGGTPIPNPRWEPIVKHKYPTGTLEVRESPDLYLVNDKGDPVCLVGGYAHATKYSAKNRDDARRLAAAWNACRSISTEALESCDLKLLMGPKDKS